MGQPPLCSQIDLVGHRGSDALRRAVHAALRRGQPVLLRGVAKLVADATGSASQEVEAAEEETAAGQQEKQGSAGAGLQTPQTPLRTPTQRGSPASSGSSGGYSSPLLSAGSPPTAAAGSTSSPESVAMATAATASAPSPGGHAVILEE